MPAATSSSRIPRGESILSKTDTGQGFQMSNALNRMKAAATPASLQPAGAAMQAIQQPANSSATTRDGSLPQLALPTRQPQYPIARKSAQSNHRSAGPGPRTANRPADTRLPAVPGATGR
ncbi:MAG: hypothetical protein JXR55_06040 [Candidatus Fermentibacteraceae bacterium]|nr:hypothetical protein [Candidatus Fermentibacteraceae bacterium]